MRPRTFALGLFVVSGLLISSSGCGGGGNKAASPETSSVTETTTTSSEAELVSWTEFGATSDDWNSAHDADSTYAASCCFVPGPKSAGGRYAALHTSAYKGIQRVDSWSLFWTDSIPVSVARQVVKDAAPPQSKLVFTTTKPDCVLIQYRSKALTRAFGSKSAVMLAALYSSASGSFDGTVNDAEFLPVGGRSLGC